MPVVHSLPLPGRRPGLAEPAQRGTGIPGRDRPEDPVLLEVCGLVERPAQPCVHLASLVLAFARPFHVVVADLGDPAAQSGRQEIRHHLVHGLLGEQLLRIGFRLQLPELGVEFGEPVVRHHGPHGRDRHRDLFVEGSELADLSGAQAHVDVRADDFEHLSRGPLFPRLVERRGSDGPGRMRRGEAHVLVGDTESLRDQRPAELRVEDPPESHRLAEPVGNGACCLRLDLVPGAGQAGQHGEGLAGDFPQPHEPIGDLCDEQVFLGAVADLLGPLHRPRDEGVELVHGDHDRTRKSEQLGDFLHEHARPFRPGIDVPPLSLRGEVFVPVEIVFADVLGAPVPARDEYQSSRRILALATDHRVQAVYAIDECLDVVDGQPASTTDRVGDFGADLSPQAHAQEEALEL